MSPLPRVRIASRIETVGVRIAQASSVILMNREEAESVSGFLEQWLADNPEVTVDGG